MRKIGANIDLKGLVIHQVIKKAGDRRAVSKLATQLLSIEEKEKSFIAKIYKAYFERSKPLYGIFAEEHPTFKNRLSEYLNDGDFLGFSQDAVEHYKVVIKDSVPATGGFVVFAHFENTDKHYDYVLVMTLTNKDGFVVSEDDLSIQDIKNLDLSKIDVACMINLSKWQGVEDADNTDSKTYLSFSKGNKDVSYYFLTFIDCNNKTTATDSTNRLLSALNDYYVEQKYDRETTILKRNEVHQYCIGCMDERREIQLSAISAILDPENTDKFELFAADDRYSVSPVINGDRAKIKIMKFVSYRDKKLTIEFDTSLLGADVVLNRQKKQLTFKNVPDKLIAQIPE